MRSETPAAGRVVAGLGLACLLAGLIAASRAAWICDDAYISFRYARNLVDGLGLVFNPGERVEGYTNFLWTIWSALAIRLGVDPRLWAQGWGIACYGTSIVLLAANHWSLRKALGISVITLPVGAAIAAVHEEWIVYATGGLETSCFTLLALIGFLLLAGSDRKAGGRPLAAGLVMGLLTLTRPDGMLFAAMAGLFVLWDVRTPGRAGFVAGLRFAGGVAALWLPFTLWRVTYYGDFFPNTYYAKSADLFWITQGWIYVRLFFAKYWVLLPALPLAWIAVSNRSTRGAEDARSLALRQTVLATGFVLAYTLFVIKVGGDFMFGRFLVPIVPFLAVLCDIGLLRMARRSGALQVGAAVLVVLALLISPQPIRGQEIVHGIADERRHYTEEYLKQVTTGAVIIERYLSGLDVRVAFSGSEARLVYEARLPHALECETGLTDQAVARQVLTQRGRVGHEKHADLEYIVGERKAHLAFKLGTMQMLGAGGRLPDSRILLEDSELSPGKPVQGFVLHWDPELMAELKQRGVIFRDFPTDLDKVIAGLPTLPREEVERIYKMSELFYFDHVDDPQRRQAFEARLQAGE